MKAKLVRALVAGFLLFPGIASAGMLWEFTVTALAYNTVTGEVGNETARYRFDHEDLTLFTCCFDPLEGVDWTLSGPILNYSYHGVDNGAGGSAAIEGGGMDFFFYVRFGGSELRGFENLKWRFWEDPDEFSFTYEWGIEIPDMTYPILGGEGDFVWIRTIVHYEDLLGVPIDPSMVPLILRISMNQISEASEPATLVLLCIALAGLGFSRRRRNVSIKRR